jgi:hypothetical protein
MSLARLERLLRSSARIQMKNAPDDPTSSLWVDEYLARLPAPWKLTCLRRAAVLYYLLRSSGRTVDLCIGVKRDEHGELLAHAWLVRDGIIYVEPATASESVPEYTLIAQFPESTARSA